MKSAKKRIMAEKRKRSKVKTTFSVNMDDSLMMWVDAWVEKGLFRDRTHGINSCVRVMSKMPITDFLLLISQQNLRPTFLPEAVYAELEGVQKEYKLSSISDVIAFVMKDESSVPESGHE